MLHQIRLTLSKAEVAASEDLEWEARLRLRTTLLLLQLVVGHHLEGSRWVAISLQLQVDLHLADSKWEVANKVILQLQPSYVAP